MTGCISLLEDKRLKARSRLNRADQDLSTQTNNVPCSRQAVAHRVTESESRPSSLHSSLSELTDTAVISDEDAASRLGIVAALDPSAKTPLAQQRSYTEKWQAKEPPHRRLHDAFIRLKSHLAKLFDQHIDDLKPFLRSCQKNEEWPYKLLEVEDIDNVNCTFQTIFNIVRIENFWLDTHILIRLSHVLPDKKSQRDAKQHLEAYHKLLGVFSKFVLLKCLPEDGAFEHFRSSLFPKLKVTYDVNLEDFAVSKLLQHQEFLSNMFDIPEEAFRYIAAKPTNSTLVTWALSISNKKVITIFERAEQKFWNLMENSVIRFEIEGVFQLHLRGKDLPKLIKEALQHNYDFLSSTEHVSRQLLALVDYSHPKRRSSEMPSLYIKPLLQDSVPLSEPGVQARTCPSNVEVHRMAERPGDGSSDQDMESGPVEDPPLLLSPHRGEGQQSTEQQRPDDENKSIFKITLDSKLRSSADRIRPNDDVGTDVEVRLDGINVGDEDRPNKPIKSVVNIDSEAECAMQGDIFEAAQSGNVQTVKNYLDLGIPPDLVDEQGWSILHHAASHGQVDVMRLLHSKGCSVNPRDRHGRTPLHHAASSGACASIGVLVEELGSEVNPVDDDGFTPLKRSVDCEQYAVMKELLRCGRGVILNEDLKSMLFQAAKTGDAQHVFAAILESERRLIDAVDSNGCNALHWAAGSGAVKMIPFLIKCGFYVNRGDKMGRTALHVAAQYGHQEVVSTLVDAGCPIDMEDGNGFSFLHWAAKGGAVDTINFLIKCGMDVNSGSKTGVTALHVAALYGHQKVVSALVDSGCPIDMVDSNGYTALHYAASGGAVEMISFLIEGEPGFDVNGEGKDGYTPLHEACDNSQLEAAFELLRHGAVLTKVAGRYGTPLHVAATKDDASFIDDILKFHYMQLYSGPTSYRDSEHPESTNPLDVCDSFGMTPAFLAAGNGLIANLERLVANNCNIRVQSNIKFSIFDYAIVRGRMSQLQAIASACRVDAGSTSQGELLRTLQAKDLLDPSKLLILGAIGGDPLVIDSLSGEEGIMFTAAAQVWSDTYCRMLVKFNFSNDDKDDIYDSLCLPSASPLTPLQIAVIFLKCITEYYRNVESQIAKTVQTAHAEFILKLITHPDSMFTVNVRFHNGLSPLDVAQQFGLRDIADMIESAGGRPGMWADLPNEVMIPAMKLYCSEYGHHLSSHGPTGLASLSRVFEEWVEVSPQLQDKSVLGNQQTSADAVLHQKPTRNLLIKHVLPRVMMKQKWRNLCILLDLEEDQVPKGSDQDDDDLYQAVLFTWLEHGYQVSWESLFDVLDTFERGKTVKEIRAKVLEELQPSAAVTSPPTPSPVSMPLALPPHHGVQTLAISGPAPHRSREALLPHQRLMDRYRDRLLEVVPAKELVLRWYNHGLVSNELYYQICPEHVAPSTARSILFRFFWDHGTQQSFEKAFCQIMVEGGRMGYHQAAQLGREMQEDS